MAGAEQGWKLVIHGGAGVIERERLSAEKEQAIRASLGHVLEAGATMLAAGRSALDTVEACTRLLEDDPHYNAGRGAALTQDGRIELDAAIMDGQSRAAGAVAGVTRTRNPISLARAVMEKSEHVLLAGVGADAFATAQGLEQVDPSYFMTESRQWQLRELKERTGGTFDSGVKYGTVGAVALDLQGHVAAATSTGGLTGKCWGRVGDSPVVGAGTYADDRAGAVSATGSGEHFIRAAAAHEICARIRMRGESAHAAADAAIAEVGALGGSGGVIVVTPKGEAVWALNTPGMYRGMASAEGREVAIFADS
jgi:beta-aspartyl-peptidase (threonine type)